MTKDDYTDDSAPAWWEIAGALLVDVVVIAILVVFAWSLP